jgi:Acetylornithine deacetylase/Succinyl-diaminopimelate desuccinylase and related deacylases
MDSAVDADRARVLHDYLARHRGQMLAVLEALVRAESPTDVPAAQAEAQGMLARLLRTLGFRVRSLPAAEEERGHLYARPKDRPRGRPVQLLVGHSDTVWARGTLDEMPFEVDDNEVRGPGVFDMKAG